MITIAIVGIIAATITTVIAYGSRRERDPMEIDNTELLKALASSKEKQYEKIQTSMLKLKQKAINQNKIIIAARQK